MEIIHCDVEHLRAALEDPRSLRDRLQAHVPDGLIDDEFRAAFVFSMHELENDAALFGFWTALFVHEGVVCGMGGFKGPPGPDGHVEIGYSIVPSLRGNGLATLAARELVRIAFADPRTTVVVAHTLAGENASVRVLRKNGFRLVRELIDTKEHPDPIWRWELQRP